MNDLSSGIGVYNENLFILNSQCKPSDENGGMRDEEVEVRAIRSNIRTVAHARGI